MSEEKKEQNVEEKKKKYWQENFVDKKDEDEDGDDSGDAGKREEDDEENFIKKDDDEKSADEKRSEVFENIKNLIDNIFQKLGKAKSGIRPEGNQQRNLDRETGGLEAHKRKGDLADDVWDKRGAEIQEMIEDGEDLNNASKSSRAQGFIHVDKQRKRKSKKRHEQMVEASEGYVAKVTKWRKNKEEIGLAGPDSAGSGGRMM